ncbi:MAG TPA: F0F1 ATP synthase subunit delta [Roseiarcus sp.]|nr:F0F1 ATP synthase subunit delta [Roseiarcus sp.]
MARNLDEGSGGHPGSNRSVAGRHNKGSTLADESEHVSGVAGRYASALYALADEQRQTAEIAAALATIQTMLDESADLRRLVRSPAFSAAEQTKALDALLTRAGVSGVAANFVRLVAAKRRLFALSDMIRDYNKLYDAARGLTRAEVTSAAPLSEAEIAALKDQLRGASDGKTSGGKDVELAVKVDPAIIGGLVVKLGSRMVDGSLRTKLNAIRTAMKEVG